MKRTLSLCLAAVSVMALSLACNKTPEQPDNKPDEKTTLKAPVLSVSTPTFQMAEEATLAFSWTDIAQENVTPKYALQITAKGDTDFAAGVAYEVNGTNKPFSTAEVNDMLKELGKDIPVVLTARVRATAEGYDAVLSNVVEVNVTAVEVAIEHIFPIGEATPWGWSLDNAEEMTANGGIFTWQGKLIRNAEFKFLTQRDWWPGLVHDINSDDPYAIIYAPTEKVGDVNMDNKFKVDKTGEYKLTIDAKSSNALKLTVELVKEIEEGPIEVNELFILGSATVTGWSLDQMYKLVDEGNGIFTIRCALLASGEFRFPLQKEANKWWPCLVQGETEGTLALGQSDGDNNPFRVAEDGVYDLRLDINAMTITMTLTDEDMDNYALRPTISELFVLGDACETGWSLDNMTAFTQDGDIFTWEGHLDAGKEFRFPMQRDWWPCLVMGATEGTLKVGNGDGDKNQIPIDKSGTWKIVVDAEAYTYTMTCTQAD